MPKPPAYASPPPGWGRVERVEALFADYPVDLTIERATMEFESASPETFIDLFAEHYGPLLQARKALDGRWPALREELIDLSVNSDVGEDGGWRARSDYLVIVGQAR